MYNEVIKQQPVNFLDLERAYSDFATGFITAAAKKKQPFFLYYPSHVRYTEIEEHFYIKYTLSPGQLNYCKERKIRFQNALNLSNFKRV